MRPDKHEIKKLMMERALNRRSYLSESNEKIDVSLKVAKSLDAMFNSVDKAASDISRSVEMKNDRMLFSLMEDVESAMDKLNKYLDDTYEWDIL